MNKCTWTILGHDDSSNLGAAGGAIPRPIIHAQRTQRISDINAIKVEPQGNYIFDIKL